ncbi:MAG: hypothetical protein AAF840_07655, partial [Bacteroidota bacterium]
MTFSKFCLLLFCCLLFGSFTLTAQGTCNNIDNRQRFNTGSNQIFFGQAIGQTFRADASCLGGTAFSEFSIRGNGNSPTKWDLYIYKGEVQPTSNPTGFQYKQTGISFPPGNLGANHTATLAGGQGSLDFVDGQMYTIYLVGKGGNMIAHTTTDAVPGKAIVRGQFFGNADLCFSLKAGAGSGPVDPGCDVSTYPTVRLNGKTWLAKNMDCKLANPESGWCGLSDDCSLYGRYYSYENAKRACANLGSGWRLPTDA